MHKTKLHAWLAITSTHEHDLIAKEAGVHTHYLRRLSRKENPNPGLDTCRRIVKVIQEYTEKQPPARGLPVVTLEDL